MVAEAVGIATGFSRTVWDLARAGEREATRVAAIMNLFIASSKQGRETRK
jgi:hypothetical protein